METRKLRRQGNRASGAVNLRTDMFRYINPKLLALVLEVVWRSSFLGLREFLLHQVHLKDQIHIQALTRV